MKNYIRKLQSNPFFYGKFIFLISFFLAAWIIEPAPLYAYMSGLSIGMALADGFYYHYRSINPLLQRIKFVGASTFGILTATGMVLNRLYEDRTLEWYVIGIVMVGTCVTLIRTINREYKIDAHETGIQA